MSTATKEPVNKVKISDAGPCRKKVHIEIPAETVDGSIELTMATLASEAELPGFRRGHVPQRLIEKKFGGAMRNQAKEQLVASAFEKAVKDHNLKVLGQPTSETLAQTELVPGKPLAFELEVEVLPEFELPKLDGIEVRKPMMTVTDEMVSNELNKLAVQEGRLEERQSAEPLDYVTGHAKLFAKGDASKVFFESEGIVVQIPAKGKHEGMIVGLLVKDLEKQLSLPKLGTKVTIHTTGPENHENEALRGIELVIEYTPNRCDRIIPATTDELVTRFGMPDASALSNAIKMRLEQRVGVEQSSVMRQQLAKHLLENVKMDLPERITANQAGRNLERRRLELMYRGVDAMEIEKHIAELRSASAADAVGELKLFFITDKAAEQLGVKVTEGEINARIAQMAAERNERPDKLRQQLIQSNQVGGVFTQIREHKTLDAMLTKAKVIEMPVPEFEAWIKSENAKHAPAAAKDEGEKKPAKKK
jgi:trigger factor